MTKLTATLSILGIALGLSGCSVWSNLNRKTANTGDAMPLYPVTTQQPAAKSINGHWYIATVGTHTLHGIEDDQWPYLDFVDTEARFYGNDGCNIINGSYRIGPMQTLALSNVATSMRLCPDDSLSYPIANALNSTASYSIAMRNDGTRILSLHNDKNFTVMTLRMSDIDFINGPWQVVGINGNAVNAPDARLIFDVAEETVSGCAGCNRLMGKISRNPQVNASLQLSDLVTTRMTCPDIATESALLIALEEVTSAKPGKDNTVILLDADGKPAVTLKKLNKNDL